MEEIRQSIKQIEGRGIVVRGNDIDTDQIIPARFMKVVTFDGLGEYAFYDLRYQESGEKKPHPFNEEKYQGAGIMIVNRNFGCGSSREHAPQALMRSGIRAVIGESFAEIFAGNCTAMGVPTVALAGADTATLMDMVETDPAVRITLDLPGGTVTCGDRSFSFEMHPAYRSALIAGSWDSTSVLLSNVDAIETTAGRLPYITGFSA